MYGCKRLEEALLGYTCRTVINFLGFAARQIVNAGMAFPPRTITASGKGVIDKILSVVHGKKYRFGFTCVI
jgi:hypothetical protein